MAAGSVDGKGRGAGVRSVQPFLPILGAAGHFIARDKILKFSVATYNGGDGALAKTLGQWHVYLAAGLGSQTPATVCKLFLFRKLPLKLLNL